MDSTGVESLIGTTIEGRYRVVRQLGQGGTSFVLLAFHEELETHVALKVLSAKSENNDNLFAHSMQEARLLARLNHPNIVRIHDYFRGRIDAMVLEYIEGHTLAKLSRGTPIAWPRTCRLLLQCCAAVEALHEAGFIHRDLNPQNFMVQQGLGEDDERVKLIDLGTAKHLQGQEPLAEDLELTTTIPPCTPAYIAPEHARGELRGSISGDTYGLVVTLYACVVGRPPWTTGAIELLLRQIAMEPAFIPEHIVLPEALRRLILRGLDKDPALRFANPAELAAALRALLKPRVLEVTGSPATATSAIPASPQRPQRRRWPVAAAAAAAALVVTAAAITAATTASVSAEPLQVSGTELDQGPVPLALTPSAQEPMAAPVIVAAPTDKSPRPQADPATQLRRLTPRLRKCPSAPTGRVLFELDAGLRRIDLMELDRDDPWHRCAAATVAGVHGTARVDLNL